MFESDLDAIIGKRLGRYKVLSFIGRGGMGIVYLAEDTRLGRRVALKLLPHEFLRDPDRVRRFEQEARAASALSHPNIVSIYDICEAEEGHFIIMELVEGRTLREIAAERFDIESLARLGRQIATALSAAHTAGIIHRDIKPENIMVRSDGYAKVLDFGLARLSARNVSESADTAYVTARGLLVGTMAYMSPEQARGEKVTGATDIFSLGIVLYELITRKHPFPVNNQLGLLHAIMTEHPLPLSALNPEAPAPLESLVMRMLEKDARLRPTAAEVEAALDTHTRRGIERTIVSAPVRHHSVGRDRERSEIGAAFQAVSEGKGLLLCVSGEPGIGKTTLVEDFLDELRAGGTSASIARGRCSEQLAGSGAYLPILESLESLLRAQGGHFSRIMRAIAPTWYAQVAPLSPDDSSDARMIADIKMASQERLKREMSALLEAASRESPVILFIDDMHWADESTTDLLAYLGSRLDRIRALIVATYRPSDSLLANHPFLPIKLEMQSRGYCRELALEFLSLEEVERYLAQEFPENRFPAELAETIYKKTEGSPLFMTDLVRYLVDKKEIVQEEGQWRLSRQLSDISGDLPQSVRSMIQRKVDQLEQEDRRLLVAASVQGFEFDSAVVAKALELDPSNVEERLEELERVYSFVRLLGEEVLPDRTVTLKCRFVHALYQNALYASLKPTRRAALSAAVAEALLDHYKDQAQAIASGLVLLFEAARDHLRASDFFLLASRNAAQLFANREAVRLARRGLESLDALAPGLERDQKELALQLGLVVPLVALKGYGSEEVKRTLIRVRDLCEQFGETRYLFNVQYGLYWVYHSCSENDKAWRQLEILFDLAEKSGDPGQLMQAHNLKGSKLFYYGKHAPAREHLEKAVALYDPRLHAALGFIYGMDPGLYSLSTLGRCLWVLGYPEQSRKVFQEALALARQAPHALSRCLVMLDATRIYISDRDAEGLQRLAQEVISISTEHENGLLPWGTLMRGYASVLGGRKQEGVGEMRRSLNAIKATGMKVAVASGMVLFADALNQAEEIDEAMVLLDESLERAQASGEFFLEPEIYRLKGEALLKRSAKGGTSTPPADEAESCFQKAIEIARGQGARSLELKAAMALSRLY
ncbi:MAG TPA: protein kinase [Blastocatellia bacterium]|nr:protein kinase [Blastocatellia bacterium]